MWAEIQILSFSSFSLSLAGYKCWRRTAAALLFSDGFLHQFKLVGLTLAGCSQSHSKCLSTSGLDSFDGLDGFCSRILPSDERTIVHHP